MGLKVKLYNDLEAGSAWCTGEETSMELREEEDSGRRR